MKAIVFAAGMLLAGVLAAQTQVIDAGAAPGGGDQFFSPAGTCAPKGTCRTTSAAMGPAPMSTQRFGFDGAPFVYRIPEPAGTYDVVLKFSESVKTKPGQRVFTVTVQNEESAPVDLVALTGGPNITYVQTWPSVPVRAGMLTIRFAPVLASNGLPIGNPVINDIEVTPQPAPTAFPLTGAIDGQNRTYTVPAGPSTWSIAVFWNGLYMTQGIDFTLDATRTVVTFQFFAPGAGDILTGMWL